MTREAEAAAKQAQQEGAYPRSEQQELTPNHLSINGEPVPSPAPEEPPITLPWPHAGQQQQQPAQDVLDPAEKAPPAAAAGAVAWFDLLPPTDLPPKADAEAEVAASAGGCAASSEVWVQQQQTQPQQQQAPSPGFDLLRQLKRVHGAAGAHRLVI